MNDLLAFASRFSLTPLQTATLPAIFDEAAAIAQQPRAAIVARATYSDARLGEYIADVAARVAAEALDATDAARIAQGGAA